MCHLLRHLPIFGVTKKFFLKLQILQTHPPTLGQSLGLVWGFCELRPGRHAAAPASGSGWRGGLASEGEGLAEETARNWEAQGVLDLLGGQFFFSAQLWYQMSLGSRSFFFFFSNSSLKRCFRVFWSGVSEFHKHHVFSFGVLVLENDGCVWRVVQIMVAWALSLGRWLFDDTSFQKRKVFSACVSTFHVSARFGQPFWLMPNATFIFGLIGYI